MLQDASKKKMTFFKSHLFKQTVTKIPTKKTSTDLETISHA